MPNWVQNNLIITGNPASIAALIEQVKSKDSDFDFEKITPMPKTLHIESGSDTDKGINIYTKYLKFLSDSKKEPTKELEDWFAEEHETSKRAFELGKIAYENVKKYGCKTWYEWSCRYWGTKWNACEARVEYTDGSDHVLIYFQTAWSTPEPVIYDLSTQYPDLTIECEYADEDMGSNCGMYKYENGEITSERIFPHPNDDSLEWACEVWGYDYSEYVKEYCSEE